MTRPPFALRRHAGLLLAASVLPLLIGPIAEAAERPRTGLFVRASGLVIEPQNDGRYIPTLDADPATVDFDTGGGFSLALGYRYYPAPISLEVEYAYRYTPGDVVDATGRFLDSTNISAHTIGANVVFDADELVGPVGVYAGLGVGVRISELRISTSTIGGPEPAPRSTAEASGNGFFWQAMAGLTFSINQRTQLYGGVRWVDLGNLDDDDGIRVDAEQLNFEFGLRYWF